MLLSIIILSSVLIVSATVVIIFWLGYKAKIALAELSIKKLETATNAAINNKDVLMEVLRAILPKSMLNTIKTEE